MTLFDKTRARDGAPPKDQEECDGCGWATRELVKVQPPFKPDRGPYWICEVCWATPAGNAVQYPEQHPEESVLKQIAYGTNMVLAALREKT